MRVFVMVTILALAGCNEHAGWNPNYVMSSGPYGEYLRDRENALTGQGPAPKVIPVQLPAEAPTPAAIAGGHPRAAGLSPSGAPLAMTGSATRRAPAACAGSCGPSTSSHGTPHRLNGTKSEKVPQTRGSRA